MFNPQTYFDRYLTQDELKRLFEAAHKVHDPLAQRDWNWMNLMYLTALRVTEFSMIRVGDVQQALKSGALYIPKAWRKKDKDGDSIDVRIPITQPMRSHLARLLMLAERSTPDSPLIAGRDGLPMSVRQYQLRMAHWVQTAGLPVPATPHWLRHSRAKHVLESSKAANPLGIVQRLLGHRSITNTAIYTLPGRGELQEALEEIDSQTARRPSLRQLRKQFSEAQP